MRDIYLVRHGETEWNASGRYQGRLDSALTRTGSLQAAAIGRKLARLSIQADNFVASPLGRTRETASIIASCASLPHTHFDERLAEVSVGCWDGLSQFEIDAQWPGLLDGSTPFDWFFRSPDGESYHAASQRAGNWLDNTQGVTVAVSHGLFGRIVRGIYLGLSVTETLSLPVPQDVIWRLHDGEIDLIGVD